MYLALVTQWHSLKTTTDYEILLDAAKAAVFNIHFFSETFATLPFDANLASYICIFAPAQTTFPCTMTYVLRPLMASRDWKGTPASYRPGPHFSTSALRLPHSDELLKESYIC